MASLRPPVLVCDSLLSKGLTFTQNLKTALYGQHLCPGLVVMRPRTPFLLEDPTSSDERSRSGFLQKEG